MANVNGLWFWNRGQVGGRSALDFLIKVRGISFLDAVETVLGARGAEVSRASVSSVAASASLSAEGIEVQSSHRKQITKPV